MSLPDIAAMLGWWILIGFLSLFLTAIIVEIVDFVKDIFKRK